MKETKTFSEWYFERVGVSPKLHGIDSVELQILHFHYCVQSKIGNYEPQPYEKVRDEYEYLP